MIDNFKTTELLMRVMFGLKKRVMALKEKKNVKFPEVHGKVIMSLSRTGTMAPTELAAFMGKDKAQLARIILALESAELVNKIPNEDDKRAYYLELTSKGKRKAKKISEFHADAASCLLEGFTQVEREQLEKLLNKMLLNLQKH